MVSRRVKELRRVRQVREPAQREIDNADNAAAHGAETARRQQCRLKASGM
jgi:hypothetical protein